MTNTFHKHAGTVLQVCHNGSITPFNPRTRQLTQEIMFKIN